METARLQQQREEEAEARRQARAAEKAAEKAGFQRKPLTAPAATAVKEETMWRRSRVDGQAPIPAAARPESPAPAAPAKYRPPIAAGGGWRAKQAAAAGGGGSRDGAAPPVVASPAHAPVPLKEESKLDEDGFQTVPARGAKEVWRPRRGRA